MSIDAVITGADQSNQARVDSSGALHTLVRATPAFGSARTKVVFRQNFSKDGTKDISPGNIDMRVVGTISDPIDFFIPASVLADRYIASISFLIADQLAQLDEFGHIGVLLNGIQILAERSDDTILLNAELKTNFDIVRLCQGNPAFGDSTSAFRAPNVIGNSEAYMPVLDVRRVFGFQWGMPLSANTSDKLIIRIRDDLTGVDAFDVIASGFDRIPDSIVN